MTSTALQTPTSIRRYIPAMPQRWWQTEADTAASDKEFFAFLMAMRTGKSKTALDNFFQNWLDQNVDDMLILAPAGSLPPWKGAIDEHVDPNLRSIVDVFHFEAKKAKGKRVKEDLDYFMKNPHGRIRILLVNVEAISAVEEARKLVLQFCSQRRVYCALDEATAIKNVKAERTKFIVKAVAPRTKMRRILTGLINPQSPLDVYAQFTFLKPGCLGFDTWTAFRNHFAVIVRRNLGGRWFDQIVGYQNEDELHERMKPHMYRVTLEQVSDQLPSTYELRAVDLTQQQRFHYEEMKRYSTTSLSATEHVTSTIVITQLLKLHQILCGFVVDEMGETHSIPENRTSAIVDILQEYDGKAIIWCAYDHSIRRVSEALQKEFGDDSVARFWGGNRDTREQEEAQFKTNPKCRFMVATASAGGKGRTWDMADLVLYHSSTSNLEHRAQSEERPKNFAKRKSIGYIDTIVPGTVEEKILHALRAKKNLADVIQGDEWREWIV